MTTRRKGRPRKDELYSSVMLRRSPRLSTRLSHEPPQLGLHQLHTRATLGSYQRGYSRSATPSTILDESGQSVPPSFDELDVDDENINLHIQVPPGHVEAGRLVIREVQDKAGMPKHLFGLDYDEVTSDDVSAPPPLTTVPVQEPVAEPARLWNIYDKERLVVTAEAPPQRQIGGHNFVEPIKNFFSSLLFKLGSLFYLASTTVMCLDVIIFHRLFNFSSSSQRTGSVTRFFFLLLALCTLIGILLGGNIYPYERGPKEVPTSSISKEVIEEVRRQFKADIDNISTRLETLKQDNANNLKNMQTLQVEKLKEMMDDLEAKHKANSERLSTLMNQVERHGGLLEALHGSSGDHSVDTVLVREELAQESVKRQDEITKLKEVLLDEMKTTQEQQEAEVLRVNQMLQSIKMAQGQHLQTLTTRVDDLQEKQQANSDDLKTVSTQVKSHGERISTLKGQSVKLLLDIDLLKKEIELWVNSNKMDGDSPSFSEGMVVQIFDNELRKAIGDDQSALGQWLVRTAASKDDVNDIEEKVDTLMSYSAEGANVSRQDIEQMIEISLQVYNADRVGSFDFVLENAGGCVMLDHCSLTYTHSVATVSLFGFTLWHIPSSPKVIIQPSLYPGDCWAMEGQSGFATLKMSAEVTITAVTLDHIPRKLTPNGTLTSAPKNFTVFGLTSLDGEERSLGSFSYDLSGPNIQKYPISEALQDRPYQYVKFAFTSNHGNKDYTCVYRVRVHGHYP